MIKIQKLNTLILGDDDLECRKENTSIQELSLLDTAFTSSDLEPFDLVVYQGNKGVKILKSRAFKSGRIV